MPGDDRQARAISVSVEKPAVISLRAETPQDADFLLRLYGDTRAAEMRHLGWAEEQQREFLQMQFNAQRAHYRRAFPFAAFDIVQCNGDPIGRLYIDRGPAEEKHAIGRPKDGRPTPLQIIDISLLEEFRGAGIGGGLLRGLLEEADAFKRYVALHVERGNPARKLYQRLGFTVVEDGGIYLHMNRTPQQPVAETF